MSSTKYMDPKRLPYKSMLFSVTAFLLVSIVGGAIFMLSMRDIIRENRRGELVRLLQTERIKLENSVAGEIAVLLTMAKSPFIIRHYLDPADEELAKIAFGEIERYSMALGGNNIAFWVSDTDRRFHIDNTFVYVIDPNDPKDYWYPMTLDMPASESYNFNINYNERVGKTMLWINAAVRDSSGKSVGVLGEGIDIASFVSSIYNGYTDKAGLYFFNALGEITGAEDTELVSGKRTLEEAFGEELGAEIFAAARSLDLGGTAVFSASGMVIAAVSVPSLNWYAAAVLPITAADYDITMTALFVAMLAAIAVILAAFNAYIGKLSAKMAEYVCEIERFGVTDTLTGLPNRRGFDERAAAEWNRAVRRREPLSVLMIDADNFKQYNDRYGHMQGDILLRTIAEIFSKNAKRAEDFAARWGGEEFALLLPNTDMDMAVAIAERIRAEVERADIPHPGGTPQPGPTVSIGVHTVVPTADGKIEDLCAFADKMLYRAKKSGKNMVCSETAVSACGG